MKRREWILREKITYSTLSKLPSRREKSLFIYNNKRKIYTASHP
jgi:hypothetical protein